MKLTRLLLCAAVTVAAVNGALAQDEPAHEATDHANHEMMQHAEPTGPKVVTGEVIDITCFVRMASSGPKHAKCAVYCAGLGMPIGILEDNTGTIYLVLPEGHASPQEAVKGHIGSRVTAKLKVYENGGLRSAEVLEISAAAAEG